MRDVPPSSLTRRLFEAARADSPSTATRTKVWTGIWKVSATTTTGGIAASSSSAAKLAYGGTLLGATATIGLAATMLCAHVAKPTVRPDLQSLDRTAVTGAEGEIMAARPILGPTASEAAVLALSPVNAPSMTVAGVESVKREAQPTARSEEDEGRSVRPAPHAPAHADADPLALEAELLAKARAALASGSPQKALSSIEATRHLRIRQLEPEELAVEARSLRALGNVRAAESVERTLQTRYPGCELVHRF